MYQLSILFQVLKQALIEYRIDGLNTQFLPSNSAKRLDAASFCLLVEGLLEVAREHAWFPVEAEYMLDRVKVTLAPSICATVSRASEPVRHHLADCLMSEEVAVWALVLYINTVCEDVGETIKYKDLHR